jgi:hypothetical protein
MTWGTGTAEEAWPRIVENTLGTPWEFLNFSHYGYDIEACAATFRFEASRWHPKWVIYAAYTNDLVRNTLIYLGDSGYPVWIGSSPGLLPDWLHRNSALARRLEGAWMARSLTEHEDPDWYRQHLEGLRDQVEKAQAHLIVVGLLPHVFAGTHCEVEPEFCALHAARHAEERQMVESLGIPWVDSAGIWAQAPEENYYPKNPKDPEHPGPAGQAVLGRGLAEALAPLLLH